MVCANALLRGAARSESGIWRKQKIATPAGQPPSGEPEVEIEFPFGTKEKACDGDKYVVPTRRGRLADACEVVDETAPDLVLLGLSRLYPYRYRAVSWRCIPLCGSRWEQAASIHIWHLASATSWQCGLAARSLSCVQQGRRRAGIPRRPLNDGLAIFDRLAKSDPNNTGWQRNLSVSFIKIGDVQMARGDLASALRSFYGSLAIAERLSISDPGNAGWQRDLSVSYNFVGNVQMAQGDLDGALKSYCESLATAERLAKSDPSNALWQRDLSVAYNKVGEVQAEQGDLAGALKSYREGLAIVERLAKSDPGNAEWLNPIPAMQAGSAICRCRSLRSAMSKWPRAIWPAR